MKENDIIAYDANLLSKERGIKTATLVINIVIALFFAFGIIFPFVMIARSPGDMDVFRDFIGTIHSAIIWLIVLSILSRLNRNHLRHIASIRLYKGATASQQSNGESERVALSLEVENQSNVMF